jgi:Pentapeptide repeats (8 copies)
MAALSTVAGLLLVGWLTPAPWLADHWPRVLAVGLFLVVFVVPRWFVPARSAVSLAGVSDPAARGRLEDDRLRLQNDVRSGLLQAVAAVAVISAVLVTWQQLELDRRQLRQQLVVAGQEQAAERFARALDQLGSEQPGVRLGGVYGLERIAARASERHATAGAYAPGVAAAPDPPSAAEWAAQDRVQVFEVLAAFVRASSARPPVGPHDGPTPLQVRRPDVYAAASVLARRTVLPGDPRLVLRGVRLPRARLGGARLAAADLRGADLRGVNLEHADLVGAHLERALLCGAQLQDASLRGAYLRGARTGRDTRWPSGFDWREAGVRLVDAC